MQQPKKTNKKVSPKKPTEKIEQATTNTSVVALTQEINTLKVADEKKVVKIFKVKTKEGYTLKQLFEVEFNNFSTILLIIAPDGIYQSQQNTTKTVLAQLYLPLGKLHRYKIPTDVTDNTGKGRLIGINAQTLQQMSKAAKKNDHMCLYIKENEENKLLIDIRGPDRTQKALNVVQIEHPVYEAITAPKYPNDATSFLISGTDFHKQCKQLSRISKELLIEVQEKGLKITGVTEGVAGSSQFFGSWKNGKPIKYRQMFPAKNVIQIAKCGTLSSNVSVMAYPGQPLKVTTDVGTLGQISLYLYPPKAE